MTALTRWTARHDRAITALLTSPSIRQAASRAGVSERTLRRWIKDSLFADRLTVAQREAQDTALGQVRGLAGQAVAAIRRALVCEQPGVELRAAVEVLEMGLRLRELERIWDPSVDEIERLIVRTEREIAQRQQDQDQGRPWTG
jgi:DNA-binding transcriptional MerR regulator